MAIHIPKLMMALALAGFTTSAAMAADTLVTRGVIQSDHNIQIGTGGVNKVVTFRGNDGRNYIADLGPVERFSKVRFTSGEPIDMEGYPVRVTDQDVIFANRMTVNNTPYVISRDDLPAIRSVAARGAIRGAPIAAPNDGAFIKSARGISADACAPVIAAAPSGGFERRVISTMPARVCNERIFPAMQGACVRGAEPKLITVAAGRCETDQEIVDALDKPRFFDGKVTICTNYGKVLTDVKSGKDIARLHSTLGHPIQTFGGTTVRSNQLMMMDAQACAPGIQLIDNRPMMPGQFQCFEPDQVDRAFDARRFNVMTRRERMMMGMSPDTEPAIMPMSMRGVAPQRQLMRSGLPVTTGSMRNIDLTNRAPGCVTVTRIETTTPDVIQIMAREFSFEPNQIVASPGQMIQINFVNDGKTAHSIDFDFGATHASLSEPMAAGHSRMMRFNAPAQPGTYEFHCPVGSHAEKGMKGTLIVR